MLGPGVQARPEGTGSQAAFRKGRDGLVWGWQKGPDGPRWGPWFNGKMPRLAIDRSCEMERIK